MTDRGNPIQPSESWTGPTRNNVLGVYVLYLLALISGITAIVGLVFAYINRGKADAVLESHYTYQIRTFWIGLLYSLISMVLFVIGIGMLLMVAVAVWAIIRCVKGLMLANNNEPVPDPQTWLV